MKRSSAPSLRAKHKRQKTVRITAPSLRKNQLKALQYLISAASYISVLSSGQMAGNKIRDYCYRFYHGYDEDNIGVAKMMLAGEGRFRVLWESSSSTSSADSSRIANGFGCVSGLDKSTISRAISLSTLTGKKVIDGRQILDKAKAALLEAKKLLGYWMEFLYNGQFPSGMNEEDALQHVFNRAYEDQSLELEDDNDEEEEDEEEEDGEPEGTIRDDQSNIEGDDGMTHRDDNEYSGNGGNQDRTEAFTQLKKKQPLRHSDAPLSFFPPAMLLFILYGPFGVGYYNLELSPALSMNTEAIDEAAIDGSMNVKSIKAVKIKEEKVLR